MDGQDHYDVLGVRPNAGHDEIELAYKGRRSQYHPDRYANADAETQAWATRKMQQVNEAYSVLTDASARAAHDRKAQSREQPSAESKEDTTGRRGPPPIPTPPPVAETFAEFVKTRPHIGDNEKIFKAPNIPPAKLAGALGNYGQGVRASDVVILMDDTVFGGAKEGVLLTQSEFRYKEIVQPTIVYKFSAIETITSEKGRIYINGFEVGKLNMPDKRFMKNVIAALQEYLDKTRNQAPPASAEGAAKTSSTSLDALQNIHAQAMAGLRREFEGQDPVRLIGLIDREMRLLFRLPPLLDVTLKARGRVGPNATQANTIEAVLALFVILHCYALSQKTDAHKESFGSDYHSLFSFGYLYQQMFRSSFESIMGQPLEPDEESLMAMAAMFMGRDGHAEFNFDVPRSQAIVNCLEQFGVNATSGRQLIMEFESQTQTWIGYMVLQGFAAG